MKRMFATVALCLSLAVPAAGCAGRPAPRPEPGARHGFTGANVGGALNPALSSAAANSARGISGTGTTEVIVIGNGALVAMDLGHANPGGTYGQPLTGRAHETETGTSSPSGGPVYVHGPGGGVGASPARLGGQISPGAPPGGSPNYTQAVPGPMGGGPAAQEGSSTVPAPVPGAVGSTPADVRTRVADMIRAQNPGIVEVRFAADADDALRIRDLAAAMRNNAGGVSMSEVRGLWSRAVPAGTEQFSPLYPSQGTRPTPRQ